MSDDMVIPDFALLNREMERRKKSERAKKAWITRRKPRLGRPMMYPNKTIARLPKGSLRRIDRVLKPGESQSEFVREAIEKELQAREALT